MSECSCISDPQGCGKCAQVPGAPEGRRTRVHGHRRKLLLHFRRTGMWEVPAGAGSTGGPAYRPSMAIAGNCSCISGVPTIHGHKKKDGPVEHRSVVWRMKSHPPRIGPSWASNLRCSRTALPFRWLRCGEYISLAAIAMVVPARDR